MTRPLRFAIVGLGNIGRTHLATLRSEAVSGAEVTAVVSSSDADLPAGVRHFASLEQLLAEDAADVVVVATPTMAHLEQGLAVLAAGRHLLMEKPLALSTHDAQRLLDAVPDGVIAAVMLNQRHHAAYRRIRDIVATGELGNLVRYSWTMTAWYRPDIYFDVSAWRGTWVGEGGGALLNQCIHNLDVLQWIVGLPSAVTARAGFGRFHRIEVEDEVTAMFAHDSGVNGILVASTGEAPGINQLDLVGDRGTLRYDGETIAVQIASESVTDHCANTREMFGMPAFSARTEQPEPLANQHAAIFNNVVAAIQGDAALEVPLDEGVSSLALANSMLLSAWTGTTVALPLDAAAYQNALAQRIASSQLRVPADVEVEIDMDKSYR